MRTETPASTGTRKIVLSPTLGIRPLITNKTAYPEVPLIKLPVPPSQPTQRAEQVADRQYAVQKALASVLDKRTQTTPVDHGDALSAPYVLPPVKVSRAPGETPQDRKANQIGMTIPDTAKLPGWTAKKIREDFPTWEAIRYMTEDDLNKYLTSVGYPIGDEGKGSHRLLYKNYADYAMEVYGSGAKGLAGAEDFAGLGPRMPNVANATDVIPPPVQSGDGTGTQQKEEELPANTEPSGPGKPTWNETYHIPGAPDWWRGITADQTDPELEYAMLMNSMIPFMSAEDQRAMATNLAIQFPEAFGMYNAVNGQYQNPTTEAGVGGRRMNTETNGILYQGQPFGSQFTNNTYSQERAKSMLNALETVKGKMKIPEGGLGPGYTYLQQVASAIRDFGGTNGQGATRQQFTQLMSALDPLTAATKAENLAAYGPASKMLSQPFFSAGSVMPVTKLDTGEYIFGKANASLF